MVTAALTQSKKLYTLNHSRQILETAYKWYKKNWEQLFSDEIRKLELQLKELDDAILNRDREKADAIARELEQFGKTYFKKSPFEYTWEIVVAILIALAFALVVRSMWFEPFSIPTGSMRPTYREQDTLLVTKTAFGLNVPAQTAHFMFDPSLIKRSDVVIWSGDGIDLPDTDTTFLYLFPYKKRYIKRLIGKPGDTLYFYGGKIYGLDKDGGEISGDFEKPWMEGLDHVPFIDFHGRTRPTYDPDSGLLKVNTFNHMNQPIGRIRLEGNETFGEVFNGEKWIPDNADAAKRPHEGIKTFSDFFGLNNFAKARILTKEQVLSLTPYKPSDIEEGILYLELRHTPSLTPSLSRFVLVGNEAAFFMIPQVSIIPLNEQHLKALMANMYTIRFEVDGGQAFPYDAEGRDPSIKSPYFANVEDGTYEFYRGKAYSVGTLGHLTELPKDHPLYLSTTNNIQKLFNLGIEMSTDYNPSTSVFRIPSRYAYFKDGDLYVMGGKIYDKNDPLLEGFHAREKQRETTSTETAPQIAFRDRGRPTKEMIETYGVKIPEDHYFVLGDNHARSADSRIFGFVPESNLQGKPSFIFLPPGSRWGVPEGREYPLFTMPRMIVWSLALFFLFIYLYRSFLRMRTPVFKKVSDIDEEQSS